MHLDLFESEYRLHDGRKLVVSHLDAGLAPDWIVYLPGSAPELHQADATERLSLAGRVHAPETHLLVLNKPGIRWNGSVQKSIFEKSFTRAQRIQDTQEVLREMIPDDARIALVGYSEGAYLAPELAVKDERVKSLVLLAGGTRGWLDEEINLSPEKEISLVLRKVLEIYSQKKPSARWRGFSHRTWHSYDHVSAMDWLARLTIPVLALHGAKDRLVDVETAIADLENLRANHGLRLRSKVYKDLGHDMDFEVPRVARAVRQFLKEEFFETSLLETPVPAHLRAIFPPVVKAFPESELETR